MATSAALLRDLLPSVESISAWSERLVGAALIAVGLWALRRSARVQPAPHVHGAMSHDHLHVQAGPRWMRRIGHAHAAFCLGVLHGVAGSSHFVGVLPALALPSRAGALTYIVAFGAGTVATMTAFAAAVRCTGGFVRAHSPAYRAMATTVAATAIVIGGVWLFG